MRHCWVRGKHGHPQSWQAPEVGAALPLGWQGLGEAAGRCLGRVRRGCLGAARTVTQESVRRGCLGAARTVTLESSPAYHMLAAPLHGCKADDQQAAYGTCQSTLPFSPGAALTSPLPYLPTPTLPFPAALLTVADDAFWEGVQPVTFGQLPTLQDAVTVVGYPIGGDTMSVTSGVVSRIEVTAYTHGSSELLGIQIDAAVSVAPVHH